jgi:transposase
VITKTLESAPKDATHWSTRSMASELGLTQLAVHRIWRAFGLQPHRAETVKKFLQTLDREVPADLDVHVILDNSSTHKTPAIRKWLTARPRFVLHFTPTSSSWLNLVERWFSELTTKKLRRGAHRSTRAERRHQGLDDHLEREPQALRLDQDRRADSRLHHPILHTN